MLLRKRAASLRPLDQAAAARPAKVRRRGSLPLECGPNVTVSASEAIPRMGEPIFPQPKPLVETNGTVENKKQVRRKKGRRSRTVSKPKQKLVEPLPPASLSPEVASHIISVPEPRLTRRSPVPILHPYMYYKNDLDKILNSRVTSPEESTSGGSALEAAKEEDGGSVLVGVVPCELENTLDLGGIFRDGYKSVCFSLVLSKFGQCLVRLEVGEEVWYLPVKLDSRLDSVPFEDLDCVLSSPLLKLFLPYHDSDGSPPTKSLPLELWAMERLCTFGWPSDPNCNVGCKKTVSKSVLLMLQSLYPECSLEDRHSFQGVCMNTVSMWRPCVCIPCNSVEW